MSNEKTLPALRAMLLLLLFAPVCAPAAGQSPDQARLLASNCANCHGTDGHPQGGLPALNGVPKATIVALLQDFKSGKRPSTIMQQLSKGYTDADIDAIAGYFASLKN